MNKLDTMYFEALMNANEGNDISAEAIQVIASNARKFAIIDEPGESARNYERLFAIWRAVIGNGTQLSDESANLLKTALGEYIQLLEKLERHERVRTVRDTMLGN